MEFFICFFEENFDGIWVVEGIGYFCRFEVCDEKFGVFGCLFYGFLELCVVVFFV